MIWLTWRQFRAQAVTAAAALAAFAVLLAATGPHLASLYAASGIASCHGGNCLRRCASTFLSQMQATPLPAAVPAGHRAHPAYARASSASSGARR